MIFTLFSVFGPEFPASDFVSRFDLSEASVWSKGQPLRLGRFHEDSGFSLHLDDLQMTRELIPFIDFFLNSNQKWLVALHEEPVELVLHLGVTVGEQLSFAPCLEFGYSILKRLVDERIDLHISSYPTSD